MKEPGQSSLTEMARQLMHGRAILSDGLRVLRCAMCCWENTCEFTWDVVLVVLALASSIAGLIFGVQGYLEGKSCCDGWGSHAATVLSNVEALAALLLFTIPPYTALCSWVLIQSFFHMGQFQIMRLDSLTTSTGLRCLQLISHAAFFATLLTSQLLLCWLVGTSLLGHFCGNHLMVSPAQVLVAGISHSPQDALKNFFGEAEVPFLMLGIRDSLKGLNLNTYCQQVPDADKYIFNMWLGSFLLMISQSLMAIALRGEKQRVNVHEEMGEDYGLAGEAVTGLLKNPAAVSGVASLFGGPIAGGLAGAAAEAYDSRDRKSVV